jgi:hypothetical protein
VVFVESPNPSSTAQESSWLSGFGIGSNIGHDGFVQSIKINLDFAAVLLRLFRWTEDLLREEIEVFIYVKAILA